MAGIQFRWPWRKRSDIGTEVDEEVRFHLDMRADELMKQGVSREAARRQALGEFGDVERARVALGRTDRATEGTKRRRMLAEEWWRDATLAVRSLRRAPSFTAVAVLTLGLGIGLSAVVFSVVNGVLLRPLAYPEADRLVTLWQLDTQKGEREKPAPANFLDWRDRARSFTQLSAAIPYGYYLRQGGEPVSLSALLLTKGFLENLGVQPVVGRRFLPEEYEPGGPRAMMLSERLWRNRFGGDPGIIGQTLDFEAPYQIVGVLPATLDYPERTDVYGTRGFTEQDRTQRVQTYYNVMGRLKPGVTLAQARDEMSRIGADLRREYPVANARVMVPVLPLLEHITGPVREALWVLLGAVALVLLIACVNIANLLLARGLARRSEIAVRAALGAGRGRIARQLLVESGVLAVAGGLTGIVVSAVALPAVIHAAASVGLPRVESIVLDARVLGAGFLAMAVTMLIAGGVPAWILSRGSDGLMIVRGGRGAGQPAGSKRTGRMLVAAEVAIALVLLVGASLLGQSLRRLLSEELGFATDRRLLLTTHFWDRYPEPAQRAAFLEQVISRISVLPGVEAAGAGSALPLSLEGSEMDPRFGVEGRAYETGQEPTAQVTYVTPGYFEAMRIPLLKGRLFDATDRAEGKQVVIVGETMANRIWPGEDPVGKRITARFRGPPIVREVVGVVKDVRRRGHGEAPRPEYYIPHPQSPFGSMTIVVHTARDPASLLRPVQREVWALQPDLAFSGTESLEGLLAGTLAVRRVILMTIGLFAGLGAVLAAMGIYGVISLAVAQRTRELGVRMALGAEPSSLKRMVLREGMGLASLGIMVGGLGAVGLSQLLASLLYGTAPTDPWSFAAAALLLGTVAALAAWIPARRATRVDPLVALRSD